MSTGVLLFLVLLGDLLVFGLGFYFGHKYGKKAQAAVEAVKSN